MLCQLPPGLLCSEAQSPLHMAGFCSVHCVCDVQSCQCLGKPDIISESVSYSCASTNKHLNEIREERFSLLHGFTQTAETASEFKVGMVYIMNSSHDHEYTDPVSKYQGDGVEKQAIITG